MSRKPHHLTAVITLFASLLPVVAMSQTNPRIMLEKSSSYAVDNELRAFRVPVTDSEGAVKFYDITVTLGVDLTGIVDPNATVLATPSPAVRTGVIRPGSYTATDGTTCQVTNMVLSNGRIQSFFSCLDNGVSTHPHQLSVATGPISQGHPFEARLVGVEINTHPDVDTYTWGLTTNGRFYVGTCGNYSTNWPVGAKTDGNQLILSIFNFYAPGGFRCSATFTRNP